MRFNLGASFCAVICALIGMSTLRPVNAAEWSTQPSVRLAREYNDNLQLTLQPHDSVLGTTVAPKLDFGAASDIWQVTGGAEAVQRRYSGESGLDADDRYYSLATLYRTERSTWQLNGTSSQSSVLSQEQISPDTGAVQVQEVYNSYTISPSWTWAVNELTQLELAYSLNSVSYVNGESVGLFDFSERDASVKLTNQFNPTEQIFFSAGYSIFNVPATTFESKSASYQGGIIRTFSETMQGSLWVGWRNTSSEQTVQLCTLPNPFYPFFGPPCLQTTQQTSSSRDSSSTYSGSLDKQFQTTHLVASLSRQFQPSALGGQVRTDLQSVALSRPFSEILTGSFSVANYQYRSETGNIPGIDRNYYVIQPGLRWQWLQEWSADLNYRYQHIRRFDEDSPVSSRAASLTLSYVWPKISVSR